MIGNVSKNGNVQNAKSPDFLLYEILSACKFGEDNIPQAKLKEVIGLCLDAGQLQFVQHLCVYARHEMYMRKFPIMALLTLAQVARERGMTLPGLRRVANMTMDRMDEPMFMFEQGKAIFSPTKGKKGALPQAVKRGIGDAITRMANPYTASKWDKNGADTSLKDMLRIFHPKPKNEAQGELFKKIMEGTLESADTHEARQSAGQDKAEVWGELLREGKLGYTALLKNTANIATEVNDDDFKLMLDLIVNEAAIKKSKTFPVDIYMQAALVSGEGSAARVLFDRAGGDRFRQASVQKTLDKFSHIQALRKKALIKAFNQALEISVSNCPDMDDDTVVYVDTSGSMTSVFAYTAPILAAFAKKLHGKRHAFIGFDTKARVLELPTEASMLTIANYLMDKFRGGATLLGQALSIGPDQLGFTPKTAVLLSDMQINQCNDIALNVNSVTLGAKVLAETKVRVSINLRASDSTCIPLDGWNQVAGYSPAIYDIIAGSDQYVDFVSMINGYNWWVHNDRKPKTEPVG